MPTERQRKGKYRKGSAHPRWRGGTYVNEKGYIRISAGPHRGKYLHRHIIEEVYGPLPAGVHVHHKDSNKVNNSLANLATIDNASTHAALHQYMSEVDAPDWVYSDDIEPDEFDFTE